MRRAVASLLAGAAAVVLVGCGSNDTSLGNRFGDCTFDPHTVCTNQNLKSLSLASSDLTGADFSGSDLKGTDLNHAILRDTKFVGSKLWVTDLTGADLRGADLSGATLFDAHLEGADWTGANLSGVQYCNTFLPDGSMSDCPALDVTVSGPPSTPPSVTSFSTSQPVTCLNDAIGEGIEVDWKVKNATSVSFLVDDVRATTAAGSHGVKRVPVNCDGKPHVFTIQAFGAVPPLATQSFTVNVGR